MVIAKANPNRWPRVFKRATGNEREDSFITPRVYSYFG
jgi:hypothetical protein